MQAQAAEQQRKENVESTSAKEKLASTTKKSQTGKSLDKSGKGKMKDAFDELLKYKSINQASRDWEIHTATFRKIYEKIKKDKEE